ncbi:MAG TPA: metal-binding protein [Blastocatellia bacterium]|nr:metal-binding protein [Blastocatellia bacterium]
MPSGRTHDLITLLLAPFMAAAVFYFTMDWTLTGIATAAMVFGGLMFGPDLDIQSRQYARWGPLRFLWWPYKVILPHRSRLSHSILLGTLIRVIYFVVVVSITLAVALYVRDVYIYKTSPGLSQVKDSFSQVWEVLAPIRRNYLIAAFAGLWVGATSHTVSDVLGSFFKSVKKSI